MFGLNNLYNTIRESASWAYNCIISPSHETTQKINAVIQPTVTMSAFSRACYWLTHLRPNIKRDFNEIKAEWLSIRMGEKALETLKNGCLISKIALFQTRYKSHAGDENLLKEICDLGAQIVQNPSTIYVEMTKSQIVMYDDGHCLFDAFAYAYYHLTGTDKEICTYAEMPREHLRQKVAEYEEANYATDKILQLNVDETINEIKEKTLKGFDDIIALENLCTNPGDQEAAKKAREDKHTYENLTDEQHRQNYFQQMKQMSTPALWGGQAELYALSKIFNVTIRLEQKDRLTQKVYTVAFNRGQRQSVTLVRVNNNHFNVRRSS